MNGKKARAIRKSFGVDAARKAKLTPAEVKNVPREWASFSMRRA